MLSNEDSRHSHPQQHEENKEPVHGNTSALIHDHIELVSPLTPQPPLTSPSPSTTSTGVLVTDADGQQTIIDVGNPTPTPQDATGNSTTITTIRTTETSSQDEASSAPVRRHSDSELYRHKHDTATTITTTTTTTTTTTGTGAAAGVTPGTTTTTTFTRTTNAVRLPASHHIITYAKKWRGQRKPLHKFLPVWDMIWAFIGSFLGIGVVSLISYNLLNVQLNRSDLPFIAGSFGASAVLLYSSIVSDFSQPRSVFGGHVVSAFIGVCVRKMIPDDDNVNFIACALAVSLAIVGMNLTRTLHPPGGATALIAVLPSPNNSIQNLGFLYILIPIAAGIASMILVALIVNNLPRRRVYPKWWY